MWRADAAASACDADIHEDNLLARHHEHVPMQTIDRRGCSRSLGRRGAAVRCHYGREGQRRAAAANVVDASKLDFLFVDVMDPRSSAMTKLAGSRTQIMMELSRIYKDEGVWCAEFVLKL